MTVRADAVNRVVAVDGTLDLATAQSVREAVLHMAGDVRIVLREVRHVQDSALLYLVTTLSLADRQFTIAGLSWPHTRVLDYISHH